MELPTWMRVVMLTAAAMNLLGAITFLPPGASLRALGGLPPESHQLYLATIAAFIFIFGVAYLWSALTGRADRLFITVAAAGKLSFSGLLVWFWADGSLPAKALTSGVGDFVFGILFAAWLLGTRRQPAAGDGGRTGRARLAR